jgi:hypothetical protein
MRRMLRLKHTTSLFEALDLFQLAKSQLGGVLDDDNKVTTIKSHEQTTMTEFCCARS